MVAVRTLDTDARATPGTRSLRVSWFGHASGARADGLSAYSAAIVGALKARRVETQFFSHTADGADAPSDEHVQLRSLRFKTITWSAPGSLERVGKALERFDPDVVHVSISFSMLEGAVRGLAHYRGIPTVATVHLPYAASSSSRGRVMRGLYRFHARHLALFDRCIALSDDQRRLLIEAGVSADRITVIHNGIDTSAPRRKRARRAGVTVGYLGRLDPEKRVAALVRSFLSLGWPAGNKLVIGGTGSQERQIRRMAAGHPTVEVLGMVSHDKARLLLDSSDIFVLPSTAEGLSMSLLQAMAAGAAVIATDVGEDGAALGDAGILIPVRPLEPSLTAALRRLGEDPELRAALGRRARARVEASYSLRANVDRLLEVYAPLSGRTVAA